MNELLLMKIITGLCILAVLFMYVLPKLNIRINLEKYKFTENSFKGFASFNEFFYYFRFAFNFTLKNKFVILFPMVFIISLNLINTVVFYISKMSSQADLIESASKDQEIKFTIYDYLNSDSLIYSIRQLNYGFYDYVYIIEILLSVLIFIFGIIYFLFYRKINKRSGQSYRNILSLLKLYIVFLFFNVLIFLFINFVNIELPVVFTTLLAISTLIILIVDIFFIIFIQSAFELTILVFVSARIQNKEINIQTIKEYLVFLKPLLLFNVLMVFEYKLRNSLWSIASFLQFNKNVDVDLISNITNYLYQYLDFIYFIWIILIIILFPAPFILILNKFNFTSTVHNTLRFIIDNLFRYLLIIISGIVLIYLSTLAYSILSNSIERLSHFQPIIMTLSACIKLFLAVIFYIALFKFYIDTQKQSEQNAVI